MKHSILLLEDDLQLNDTIKEFLEFKGYDVYVSYDGLKAEEILYEKDIDLMLLDIKTPKLNGLELLKKIRKRDKKIPAIFITSLDSVENVTAGFEAGCDDYIRKPFALKELLVRIESLLKRTFGSIEEKISLGNGLLFDTKELRLTKNGKKIPLKTKELKLLALFLKYPDELISYDKINETLWEYDEISSSGSLRAYIKNLRSIVGKERIETVKNIGYRFVKK